MTLYHACGTPYWVSILHYYTCMESRSFSCETDNTRRNRQNIYLNESERRQLKMTTNESNFFRGNLSLRKGDVSFFIPL